MFVLKSYLGRPNLCDVLHNYLLDIDFVNNFDRFSTINKICFMLEAVVKNYHKDSILHAQKFDSPYTKLLFSIHKHSILQTQGYDSLYSWLEAA